MKSVSCTCSDIKPELTKTCQKKAICDKINNEGALREVDVMTYHIHYSVVNSYSSERKAKVTNIFLMSRPREFSLLDRLVW